MTDKEIIKAFDILDKFEFFGGQRAGRERWFNKPTDIQNKDIGEFLRNLDFLKQFINRQQAEIKKRDADIEGLLFSIQSLSGHLSSARAEAIKEFAEKLTHTLVINNEENDVYFDFGYTLETIDNLVKEMTGETKPEKCDCFCEEQRIKGWLDGNTPITEPITVCNGTRERDECTCGGDKSKCDFYAKDYSYGY